MNLARRLIVAATLAALSVGPALAHPALGQLIPLIEVYDARRASPEFDVAGIRCSGLWLAQDAWADAHHGRGRPTRVRMADVDPNLTRAEIVRRGGGMDVSRAYASTRDDVLRVIDLYSQRFRARDNGEGLPWSGDPLIRGDTTYCDLLNDRR